MAGFEPYSDYGHVSWYDTSTSKSQEVDLKVINISDKNLSRTKLAVSYWLK
jgi:hypothetical protein